MPYCRKAALRADLLVRHFGVNDKES